MPTLAQLEIIERLNAQEDLKLHPTPTTALGTIELDKTKDWTNFLIGPFQDTRTDVTAEFKILLNVTIHYQDPKDKIEIQIIVQDCEGDFLDSRVVQEHYLPGVIHLS